MRDTVMQMLLHPATAPTAAGGSFAASTALPPPTNALTTVMHLITFVVGVLPGIIQLFKKKKEKKDEK
jgi:hypothetical protein